MTHPLLAPLGWVYGAAGSLRNAAFDRGVLPVTDVGVPVISVGNITAGGSGKTPLVQHIVRRLSSRGASPCVVSRGYGRTASGPVVVSDGRAIRVDADTGGDEPVQIAQACPGVSVVVAERRVEAARVAVEELGADVLVMDDGFQHRYLGRSLDIVVIDGRKDPFLDRLLPAGMLRERVTGVRRATLVALSRSETVEVSWSEKLRRVFAGPVISFVVRGDGLRRFRAGQEPGQEKAIGWGTERSGGPLVAFSGIGDHSVFMDELARLGIPVAADRRFGDHHWYGQEEAAALSELAQRTRAAGFVTTEKDAARIQARPDVARLLEAGGPVFTLGVTVRITQGAEELESRIDAAARAVRKTGSMGNGNRDERATVRP